MSLRHVDDRDLYICFKDTEQVKTALRLNYRYHGYLIFSTIDYLMYPYKYGVEYDIHSKDKARPVNFYE